jgi:hypothetical protein
VEAALAKDENQAFITTVIPDGHENMTVAALRNQDEGTWNTNLIQQVFNPRDAMMHQYGDVVRIVCIMFALLITI